MSPIPTLGTTRVTMAAAQAWARARDAHPRFVDTFIPLYYDVAPHYNLPAENVVCQSGKETGWGHFGDVVDASFNNPAGIKTREGGDNNDPEAHMRFETWRAGVQAHCSHLAKYGGLPESEMPEGHTRSPRLVWITTGSAPTLADLGGQYAPSLSYGTQLESLVDNLMNFAAANGGLIDEEPSMTAQIPGFVWVPADNEHYTKGRAAKVRGGAQHYSAGTNSLGWLTTDSPGSLPPPAGPVSAHFLVKHLPTMTDRGWQLVDLQDTAWTTSKANPYTVSIEYEHVGGPVPEQAYPVLAQTWIDIAEKVKGLGIGEIPLTREGIKGHREWTGGGTVCPDGIDMDRLVQEIKARLGTEPEPAPPQLGTTVPDPWADSNWITEGKPPYWIPKLFVDWIFQHGFMAAGYCASEAFDEDGVIVQYFERLRLEIHPGQVVMVGHTGLEALWARYPNRRVA